MIEKIPFTYSSDIKVINREQFDVHMRLYEGYIENINKIDAIYQKGDTQMEQANPTFSFFRELKRGETYALDGIILHELYFENIGGSKPEPDQTIMDRIKKDFKTYQDWQLDFIATAKASRGWAMLAYDQRSERYRNISLDAHDLGNVAYSAPVLVLDMYEHAYFLQYADKKADYIENFMKNINWVVVGKRMSF